MVDYSACLFVDVAQPASLRDFADALYEAAKLGTVVCIFVPKDDPASNAFRWKISATGKHLPFAAAPKSLYIATAPALTLAGAFLRTYSPDYIRTGRIGKMFNVDVVSDETGAFRPSTNKLAVGYKPSAKRLAN